MKLLVLRGSVIFGRRPVMVLVGRGCLIVLVRRGPVIFCDGTGMDSVMLLVGTL